MSIPNERVDAVAWDPDGGILAAISVDTRTDDTVVRQISWPDLVLRELDRSIDIRPDSIAAQADEIGWLRDSNVATEVRRYHLSAALQDVLLSTADLISRLQLVGDEALVASEAGSAIQIQSRVRDRVDVLYETDHLVDGFRLSPDRSDLYVLEYEVGESPVVTVASPGGARSIRLDTAAASSLSLSTADGRIVYIDQSLARLLARPADGTGKPEMLVDLTVRAGEVSAQGVVAYVLWPDDTVTTPICFRVLPHRL